MKELATKLLKENKEFYTISYNKISIGEFETEISNLNTLKIEKIKTINDIIYISFDNYTTLEYHQMPQFDTNKEVLGLVVSNFNTDQINSISNKAASKLMQIQTSIKKLEEERAFYQDVARSAELYI